MGEKKSEFKVDVKKLIRNQKNQFVKKLPGFVIASIRRLIREKELNDIVEFAGDSEGIDFIRKAMEFLDIKIQIECNGVQYDKNKRYIFVGNHPLGGIDFFSAILILSEKFSDVKVIANELLMHVTPLKDIFLPVNVFGKNSNEDKARILEMMASDKIQLMTFPSGMVARKINGKLDDGNWHTSFVRQAVEYKRDIVPFFIDAENSKKFYRFSNFRKFLGIKKNLEIFLLPGELLKQKNSTIKVCFGDVIEYNSLDLKKDYKTLAQEIKNLVYDLKK